MLDLKRGTALAPGSRDPAERGTDGLAITRVGDGEPWRMCNHDRSDGRGGRSRPCVFAGGMGQLVLSAHNRARPVGSAHVSVVTRPPAEASDPDAPDRLRNGPFLWPDAGEAHVLLLRSLWVAPAARDSGVATALCTELALLGMPMWAVPREERVAAWMRRHIPPRRGRREPGLYHRLAGDWMAGGQSTGPRARVEFSLKVTIVDWDGFVEHAGAEGTPGSDALLEWLVDVVQGVFGLATPSDETSPWLHCGDGARPGARGFGAPVVSAAAHAPAEFTVAVSVEVVDTGRFLAYLRLVAFLQTPIRRRRELIDAPRVLAAAAAARLDWFAAVELVSSSYQTVVHTP